MGYSLQTFESITCPFCIHLVCMALVSTFDSKFEKSFDDFSRLSQIFDRHIFARCRIRTFVHSCRFLLTFCDSRRDLLYLLVISIYKLNQELVWDPIMTSVFNLLSDHLTLLFFPSNQHAVASTQSPHVECTLTRSVNRHHASHLGMKTVDFSVPFQPGK